MTLDSDSIPLLKRPFYFLRHGESRSNVDDTIAGSIDVPLTERGRALLQPLSGLARVRFGVKTGANHTTTVQVSARDPIVSRDGRPFGATGGARPLSYAGTLTDVSSDPPLVGRPATLILDGKEGKGRGL